MNTEAADVIPFLELVLIS